MRRFILSIILLIAFAMPITAVAEYDANYDWDSDKKYQGLAEDFRTFTVCEAIHKNLSIFIAIHYGIGSNMNYPAEWLTQQQSLIQNINRQQVIYGDKSEKVIEKLIEEYNFPYQMLDAQRTKNQASSTQQIMFALATSSQDPNRATSVIKGMLEESKRCRGYQEKGIYE